MAGTTTAGEKHLVLKTVGHVRRLFLYDETSPLSSAIRVRTPAGRDLPLEAPEFAEELATRAGTAVSLLKLKRFLETPG